MERPWTQLGDGLLVDAINAQDLGDTACGRDSNALNRLRGIAQLHPFASGGCWNRMAT